MHVHSFCGNKEDIKLWLCAFPEAVFGLSGTVLRVESWSEEEKAVCSLDLSKILLESDAPYLTPPETLGPNHPWNIIAVAAKVARLRGLTTEMVIEVTRLSVRFKVVYI